MFAAVEPEAAPEAVAAPLPEAAAPPARPAAGVSVDEFQALEARVLRAVEIVRRERDARAAAEAEVARLADEIDALNEQLAIIQAQHAAELNTAQTQLTLLNSERDTVRLRVEKMMQQMDELL
jgi:chromosome segregation ATPase